MRGVLAMLVGVLAAGPVRGADVVASPPRDESVTVYRAPFRGAGGIDLQQLNGFALVSETRTVTVPAGESRIRFEGVADGIDPTSAIVTGLPSGVVEKNRDAHLLSPSALVTMTVGRPVVLVRRPRHGREERLEGRVLSDAGGGVVFQSAEGIEALRCSGLSETFDFDVDTPGLSPQPTLSVLTRSDRPFTATVTLTYLADGFDWAADYVATLSPDGRKVDLGAWLTLANSNATSFPDARTQVVAGRLNHTTGRIDPIDRGEAILANCWPQGTTSDIPEMEQIRRSPHMAPPAPMAPAAPPLSLPSLAQVIVTGVRRATLEQLGDLKLYRAPDRTRVASRQAKQVRLLDRQGTPVEHVYEADLFSGMDGSPQPAVGLLRTRNDALHHLGLPLPSGRIAVFQPGPEGPLLIGRTAVRDLAENELVEWRLGPAPDIQVSQVHERSTIDRADVKPIPVIPGVLWAVSARLEDASRVEVHNAAAEARAFELRLSLPAGVSLVKADHPARIEDGRPVFRLALPPHSTTVLRYQTGKPPLP